MGVILFNTAVLFLVYNRPDNTQRVFDILCTVKPSRLYIGCDGPNSNRPDDSRKIEQVQKIVSKVDWECEVNTLFRETNLGCKAAVEGSINWFFQYEEEGIILEDDCLPNIDFFNFCELLLKKYRNDDSIFAITGNNFQKGCWFGNASYYFSRYLHVWGWATWRSAWNHYDSDISFWPTWKNSSEWLKLFPDEVERKYWQMIFDKVHANEIDTWDYYWVCSLWKRGGLTATPNVNLVSNIGFGVDSTHTFCSKSPLANLPKFRLQEIIHPQEVIRETEADRRVFNFVFKGKSMRWPIFPFFWGFQTIKKYLSRVSKILP